MQQERSSWYALPMKRPLWNLVPAERNLSFGRADGPSSGHRQERSANFEGGAWLVLVELAVTVGRIANQGGESVSQGHLCSAFSTLIPCKMDALRAEVQGASRLPLKSRTSNPLPHSLHDYIVSLQASVSPIHGREEGTGTQLMYIGEDAM